MSRKEFSPSRRAMHRDRLKRISHKERDERRTSVRERRQEAFEEAQDGGREHTAEPKTAVEKLKSISPSEGIPPEVQKTMNSVREWFESEMPEISSGTLLSTRIKSNQD